MKMDTTGTAMRWPADLLAMMGSRAAASLVSIEGGAMPQPFRQLLVHDDDMTPTLEAWCGSELRVRPYHRQERGGEYHRCVALEEVGTGRPVEFGVIRIMLPMLPPMVQDRVREASRPLGGILAEAGIEHHSHPVGYFRVRSCDLINDALRLTGSLTLYGRHNRLTAADGRLIAEVIEILPPLEQAGTMEPDA